MTFSHPDSARIIIIEGVTGSGKDTLHRQLKKKFGNRRVLDFNEDQLLQSWKHVFIPNVGKLRMQFFFRLLDFMQRELVERPDTFFILTRFHLSLAELMLIGEEEHREDYERLIEQLRQLPVFMYVTVLDENEIEERASHSERHDSQWKEFLDLRMDRGNWSSLRDMYVERQKAILQLAEEQRIPYAQVKVATPKNTKT